MKKPQQAIDLSQIDLEKMRQKTAENPGLLPYAHTASSAVVRPEDKGKIKGRAVAAMQSQAEMQMKQLYQQMELLAAQANALQTRVQLSQRIYAAEMPFEPLIGHTYYLYRRHNGQDVLSMIAPHEWGRSKAFAQYVATIKLLADHTWEILDSTDEL